MEIDKFLVVLEWLCCSKTFIIVHKVCKFYYLRMEINGL